MCGIGQLSPGAYFLRRDLFPSIVMVSHIVLSECEDLCDFILFPCSLSSRLIQNVLPLKQFYYLPSLRTFTSQTQQNSILIFNGSGKLRIRNSCVRFAGLVNLPSTPPWSWLFLRTRDHLPSTNCLRRAYQDISDDSPPSLTTALGSVIASLRPDRALATKIIDPSRELFKNQWVITLSLPVRFWWSD